MRMGNPTRLEERSSGIKLFTVCMYGHGLAATALLQNKVLALYMTVYTLFQKYIPS